MQKGDSVRDKSDETTIMIAVADKIRLDRLKVHRREPYRDVIKRLLDQTDKTVGTKGPQYIRGLIDSVVGRPSQEPER
ncbi:MAG TPA: hypothetical protein VGS11_05315 [Candidatus Bathyarchaeia archaeon]|nr:hypothetical protein [Candidatus Bathyarchaeia archaeon]